MATSAEDPIEEFLGRAIEVRKCEPHSVYDLIPPLIDAHKRARDLAAKEGDDRGAERIGELFDAAERALDHLKKGRRDSPTDRAIDDELDRYRQWANERRKRRVVP